MPSKPASAPCNESWPRNLPSSGSAGLSEEFCIESSVSQANGEPSSHPQAFMQRVASAGFRLPSFMAAHKYIESCRLKNTLPDRENLLRSLIPWARRYPAPAFWQV